MFHEYATAIDGEHLAPNSFLAAVPPQTWQLNMANSVFGNQPTLSGLAHKL
jgi:hypothetical protein